MLAGFFSPLAYKIARRPLRMTMSTHLAQLRYLRRVSARAGWLVARLSDVF
jgi:hypothetical protein